MTWIFRVTSLSQYVNQKVREKNDFKRCCAPWNEMYLSNVYKSDEIGYDRVWKMKWAQELSHIKIERGLKKGWTATFKLSWHGVLIQMHFWMNKKRFDWQYWAHERIWSFNFTFIAFFNVESWKCISIGDIFYLFKASLFSVFYFLSGSSLNLFMRAKKSYLKCINVYVLYEVVRPVGQEIA